MPELGLLTSGEPFVEPYLLTVERRGIRYSITLPGSQVSEYMATGGAVHPVTGALRAALRGLLLQELHGRS